MSNAPDLKHRCLDRIVVLDDYEGRIEGFADWKSLATLSRGAAEVTFIRDLITDPAVLVRRLLPFDCVVLMRGRTRLGKDVLEALPRLKLIMTTGGQMDPAIDRDVATERGIQMCGTVTFGHPTAELTWGLILALLRHIPRAAADLQAGLWMPLIGQNLRGRTIGLIGLGRIGSQVAHIAQAFGMKVLAWSRNLDAQAAAAKGVSAVGLDALLKQSDVISVHVHGGDRYRHLIGDRELALMKTDAILVNTARAAIVEQHALLDALITRRIAGAALDVHEHEPLPVDHPYLKLDNVLATPHLGYVTEDNFRSGYEQIVAGITAFMQGELLRPLNEPAKRTLPTTQTGESE